MFDNAPIYKFLDKVRSQIKYRAAAEKVSHELTGHIEDRVDDLVSRGFSPREAAEQAVAAMGDPYEIGREFDRLYPALWHNLSNTLLCIVLALLVSALVNNFFAFDGSYRLSRLLPADDRATLDHAVYSFETEPPTLVRPATVFGGGKLGAYTFAPADDGGTAGVYRRDDGVLQLRFALTISNLSPWLDNSPHPILTIDDDLGRHDEGAGWFPRYGSLTRTTVLVLIPLPDSAAAVYTVTCSAAGGDSVTFHIHCGEEVDP